MKIRRRNQVSRIHFGRQPNRPHYIPQWAEHRGFDQQADLARELDADKSLVSRWFNGSTPSLDWQEKLAALLTEGNREALFRHPDDDWLRRFLQGRSKDEIERAKQLLDTAFPRKAASGH